MIQDTQGRRSMKNVLPKYTCFIILLLLATIFLFAALEVLLALTPPIARDVLIHHLAIPKLWLMHGGFYETPWAVYSYYPMNLDLLYLAPLYFGNDIVPNFIHLSFSLGTAVLIYLYLKSKVGLLAALLGAAAFISLPIVVRMSTTAYVDFGLVFFSTASVLALICWRDSEYQKNGWLMISAVALGLALGTKYNALLAWFFLTLAVVFIYAKDTGKQWPALKWGLVFFAVSLLVFSPWLIKNAVLTGNPFYPLFRGLFGHSGASAGGVYSAVAGGSGLSLFKAREMIYGESIWESLLIPIRFFFQGQDHSPRYFDGVLNPVLILIAPLAFIQGKLKADKLLFVSFAGFFILTAFFLDQHRIRYILPAIPFVIILMAMGFVHLFEWFDGRSAPYRMIYRGVLAIVMVCMIAINVVYMGRYWQTIGPVHYLLKKESRDQFIARHDLSYPAVRYINDHTPENSKIRLILLAGRGYYLNRPYEDNALFGVDIIKNLVSLSSDPAAFQKYLKSLNSTHFLIRYDLLGEHLARMFSREEIEQFSAVLARKAKIIFRDDHYAVCKLDI
ncbi:MAG: phospholipid carrier-dependent glycosyltransferase [Deltaproteobacteria bacterium]|nr:phospholipid carrier-dependent glycosyltransferase [Deltaproteobacteria bacterium]